MYSKKNDSWLKHWDFILLDIVMLELSFILGFVLRMGIASTYRNNQYISIGLVIAFVDICIAFFTEPYHGIMRRGYFQEFKKMLQHVFLVYVMVILYLFVTKQGTQYSRIMFGYFAAFAVVLVYLGRVLWKKYLITRGNVLYAKTQMIILTTRKEIKGMLEQVERNIFNEFEIVGIALVEDDYRVEEEINGIPVVCDAEHLCDYVQTRWVDSVLIGLKEDEIPKGLIQTCVDMGIAVHRRLDDMEGWTGNQYLNRMGGYDVLTTSVRVISSRQIVMKRLLDLCGGIVGMLLTVIITIFLGPAIYIASPGPIFFSQIRVGRNGKKFKIYKFRSMYMDAEERKKELMKQNEMQGLMFKMENDPRIIGSGKDGSKKGLGWFIRKTSLDEFPQFWNVLKGDMSLVGTRPPTVDEWNQYEPYHRARLAVKPGLTGMWQVSGRSDITDFEEVVKLDMQYVKNWNIGMDIKILFKTVGVVLKGAGSK